MITYLVKVRACLKFIKRNFPYRTRTEKGSYTFAPHPNPLSDHRVVVSAEETRSPDEETASPRKEMASPTKEMASLNKAMVSSIKESTIATS